jgi:hypothetical protein
VVLYGTWSETSVAPSVLANSKTQNTFLSPVHAMFRHDCPLAVKFASTPRCLFPPPPKKKTWRDSLPIDMVLSAVSVLVVALPSSEVPDGLMKYPVQQDLRYCCLSLASWQLLLVGTVPPPTTVKNYKNYHIYPVKMTHLHKF